MISTPVDRQRKLQLCAQLAHGPRTLAELVQALDLPRPKLAALLLSGLAEGWITAAISLVAEHPDESIRYHLADWLVLVLAAQRVAAMRQDAVHLGPHLHLVPRCQCLDGAIALYADRQHGDQARCLACLIAKGVDPVTDGYLPARGLCGSCREVMGPAAGDRLEAILRSDR